MSTQPDPAHTAEREAWQAAARADLADDDWDRWASSEAAVQDARLEDHRDNR